ncbi:glycoside hydrolase family 16 protein [Actinomyces naeslundii]|uniref:Glycosyl hydrolase family 16 n=1 Tax=Actinomyces naeslundii TaxID=1655 RepID=A0ABX3F337_ACTNA|nr:family 16 glycosylhydrolase [Actinomyces naeslundii]OLO83874.1 glycosyl hydrolase family 16 [Actinomyces naeslundii]OLO91325.1 glycosyl hydrolase family 16 [Actinomyces naeslundii]
MKPARATQLLMTAGLAVATGTACFPVQPQGADPGAAAPSTSLSTELASPGGPASAAALATPVGDASAPAVPSSSMGETTTAAPSGESSASPSETAAFPSDAGTASPSQPSEGSGRGRSEAEINGWSIDYFEGFDASFEDTKWGHYGLDRAAVGHGAMGIMSDENSLVENGNLIIRTQYRDGQWSAGGASSADAFAASRGRWEVRAKFPRAKGIGYAMLLWPEDKSWPPEVDFAEGRVNGPRVSGTYHWGDSTPEGHKQEQRVFDNPDMNGWHTYGAIVEDDYIVFTFDGQEWGRITRDDVGEGITDKRMWFGVQTGAMDPNDKNAQWYETVDGGVPGPLTPAVSDIQIDYVAHYTRG